MKVSKNGGTTNHPKLEHVSIATNAFEDPAVLTF
jgi:hypothetical protein